MEIKYTGITFIFLCTFIPALAGVESGNSSANKKPAEITFFDRLEALKNKALAETGSMKNFGSPRIVAKGGQPEIIIKKEIIYFNGNGVKLGDSISTWKKALSRSHRCSTDGITICVWEDWGLQVGTDDKKKSIVKYMNLFMNFVDSNGIKSQKSNYGIGTVGKSDDEWLVHQAFSGYLEVDGFGIDQKTKFWEIQAGIENQRALRCGLRDCANPRGVFGEHASIQMRLNGNDEHATLGQFSLYIDDYD